MKNENQNTRASISPLRRGEGPGVRWLLDAGHGGIHDGRYTTAPGKMHTFDDGLVIYEGVTNRAIVTKLVTLLEEAGINHAVVSHPWQDDSLFDRVTRANKFHAAEERCIYLSVHSDAMPDGHHGKGSGISIYTSKGQTRSDKVADIFCEVYQQELPDFKFRKDPSDGDADKEEDFYVLRYTNCPAILVENLFFDNRREAEFLLSDEGQQRIANTLFKSILETENRLLPGTKNPATPDGAETARRGRSQQASHPASQPPSKPAT